MNRSGKDEEMGSLIDAIAVQLMLQDAPEWIEDLESSVEQMKSDLAAHESEDRLAVNWPMLDEDFRVRGQFIEAVARRLDSDLVDMPVSGLLDAVDALRRGEGAPDDVARSAKRARAWVKENAGRPVWYLKTVLPRASELRRREEPGSFEAERLQVREEVEDVFRLSCVEPAPELAARFGLVRYAFGAAMKIVHFSRVEPPSGGFVACQIRLEESMSLWNDLFRQEPIPGDWPREPGIEFAWYGGDSALGLAERFCIAVVAATSPAAEQTRSAGRRPRYSPLSISSEHPLLVGWRDRALEEIRTRTFPPDGVWRHPAEIHRAREVLQHKLAAEYEKVIAKPEPEPVQGLDRAGWTNGELCKVAGIKTTTFGAIRRDAGIPAPSPGAAGQRHLYSPRDVEKLIAAVRKGNRRRPLEIVRAWSALLS